MKAAAVGVFGPGFEIGVLQAAMQLGVEVSHVAPHPLERESQLFRRSLGMIRKVEEYRIEKVRRVLRPVDPQAVKIWIVADHVLEERVLVGEDVRTGQAAVLRQPPFWDRAIGQPCPVRFDRAAELHAVAGRNRSLHLEVDADPARLGGLDEVLQKLALLVCQVRRFRRLIPQTRVEGAVRHEAGSGLDVDLTLAEERTVEQPDAACIGVGWRFPLPGLRISLFHQVGRCSDSVRSDASQVVQQPVNALALDVFREDCHSEQFRGSHRACSISADRRGSKRWVCQPAGATSMRVVGW